VRQREETAQTVPSIFRYRNPIQTPAIPTIRDAQIIRVEGRYYLTGTLPPYWEPSSPGVPLYSSDNLLDWKMEGMLIERSRLSETCWYRNMFWAPEIHEKNGRFYLTVTCNNEKTDPLKRWGQCLAVADRVTGPFRVLTEDAPLRWGGIDLSLFTDDDGRTYGFSTGDGGIMVGEIDLDAPRYVGERVSCVRMVPGTWEDRVMEGPFCIKRQGVYYLFYSCGARGYEVGYATARHPLGPWTKYAGNPIFGVQNEESCRRMGIPFTGDPNHPLLFAGHIAIFPGPDGRDWICGLYQAKGRPEQLGFDPMWIENGVVRTNGPTWTEQTVELP